MLGQLTSDQCIHVIRSKVLGRIGCYGRKKVYITPTSFVYDNGFIYAHAKEGAKISAMRKNPNVCFQVDDIDNLSNWRSIVLWGKFEEVTDHRKQLAAIKILEDRLMPLTISEAVRPIQIPDAKIVERELKAVIYRISVDEITGRFEKN
jgi:nitroimidazol reductase NimA-like FMN-containing flavoprotein (pyridoxamine 5'-phosphate oxidase superfamily)